MNTNQHDAFIRRPSRPAKTLLTNSTLALALFATVTGTKADDAEFSSRIPDLPSPICDKVNVPAGQRLSARVYALGVQIYRWSGTNWAFVAPEATLYADPCFSGVVGIHYAGPTWEAADGSKVAGARLNGCTPERGAIPWLLLAATPLSAQGRLASTTFIQRLNTIGGTAPAEAGMFVGDEARVPYTTEYYFYRAAND